MIHPYKLPYLHHPMKLQKAIDNLKKRGRLEILSNITRRVTAKAIIFDALYFNFLYYYLKAVIMGFAKE